METTEQVLERLVAVADGFFKLDKRDDSALLKDILKLRSTYTAEIAKLFGAMAQDQKLKDHPEIGQEFGQRFLQTRHAVTDLQARWRMHQIEADPRGYLAEIKPVISLSQDMLRWGLGAVRAAA